MKNRIMGQTGRKISEGKGEYGFGKVEKKGSHETLYHRDRPRNCDQCLRKVHDHCSVWSLMASPSSPLRSRILPKQTITRHEKHQKGSAWTPLLESEDGRGHQRREVRVPHQFKRVSRNLVDPKCKEGNEFFHLANKITALLGEPKVADFISILKGFDPQGIKRKSQCHMEKFVEERIQAWLNRGKEEEGDQKDCLDVLLSFRGQRTDKPAKCPALVIYAITLEMFIAGADTTTRAVEWALSELIHNPAAMTKLQSELVVVVRRNGNILERPGHLSSFLQLGFALWTPAGDARHEREAENQSEEGSATQADNFASHQPKLINDMRLLLQINGVSDRKLC
ncbi:hypothetical protein EJ110_NYTH57724 [Nymphaea thermarum]|nr:hypothetical protein EJ110_NYTH57724 [Nymphaea thermarum]